MRKIIPILLILFSSLQAYGFEDYIMMSENPVLNVYSKDENIVSVLPFLTIDNNKNTMIVKSKSEGNTEIVIETSDNTINIKVDVEENETIFSEDNDIMIFKLDFLDSPLKPTLREGE